MKNLLNSRYYQMVTIMLALMAVLAVRLFVLSVVQNEEWDTYATQISEKSIYTSAPRGEILDRYGRVIAGNKQTFTVTMDASNLSNEEINRVALSVLHVLEANGDKYFDEFPIVIENGRYEYTYTRQVNDWLTGQGIPTYYTAEQTFNFLRKRFEIDDGLSKYDAQTEMQTVYSFYPPISVKLMKYTYDMDKDSFLEKMFGKGKTEYTAEEAFNALCEKFEVPENCTIEEKRKILVVRNEIASLGYSKYLPATIATEVSDNTIIMLKEMSDSLPGVMVSSDTIRYYPNTNTASLIVGYLGKISERDKSLYVDELGYNSNDLIGQDGIESVFESTLKGTDGVRVVQVNAYGEFVREVSYTEPQKGNDVYLTIDLDLQKTAEDALARELKAIQTAGVFTSEYGNYAYGKAYRNANVGALVAIEVETGDVLAMASCPDFNPNMFATGISSADWASLQRQNLRDALAPAPLYNIACRTAVQPGSTFKPVTATAALAAGLDPSKKLYDGGYIQVGNRTYGCLIWNRSRGSHGYLDLPHALEVSCNYYFYDVATGKDHYTGKSLGYNMNIDKIMEYAQQYGLGLNTGIEITETITSVPSAEKKMERTKAALKNVLVWNAADYFKPSVCKDKTLLNDYATEIVSWAEENPTRTEIIERLPSYGIIEDQVEKVADLCKFSYFNQAQWTLGDELNIAIGQGENSYTPLQMANYAATIGNGGLRNQVSVVKSIEGRGHTEKGEQIQVDISEENLKTIIDGMKLVATGSKGSLRNVFGTFPVSVAAKTGTAEKSGVIQPPDEVEYIKEHLKQLDSRLAFEDVEAEMKRLMTEESDRYSNRNAAVDQAVINLSGGTVTQGRINQWKSEYDNFAWVIALAPADDPKIAVACLVFQGGTAGYAAPAVREVIGKYLQLDKTYEDYSLTTVLN
jgi:penicillin-binding protein 2